MTTNQNELPPLVEKANRRLEINRRQVNTGLAAGAAALSFLPYGQVHAATTMNFLGWQGYDEPLIAGDYLEKNDIVLERSYIDSNEAIITKLQAGGLGHVDVATPYYGHAKIMIDAGLVEPLDMSKIPSFKEMMPFFAQNELLVKDGTRYAVPFTWGTQPPMYRVDLVEHIPLTWMDLLHPRFRKKLVMIGGVLLNYGVWSKPLLNHHPGTWITHAQMRLMTDFLIDMKRNHARLYTDSYGEMTDILARGDATICDFGWEPVVLWGAEKGAEIGFNYPAGGTMAFMDTYAIPKNAPHIDAAHAMIEHGISIEGQTHLANSLGQAVVNQAAVPLLDAKNRDLYLYDEIGSGNTEALADIAYFVPFPPRESDGVHATHDEMLEEWERFLKA